jgi:hypothetical protein
MQHSSVKKQSLGMNSSVVTMDSMGCLPFSMAIAPAQLNWGRVSVPFDKVTIVANDWSKSNNESESAREFKIPM